MADAGSVITESNENNVFSIAFTVTAPTALPDIYITGAAASATTVIPGQLIDVSFNQFTSISSMALDTVFLQYRWNTVASATGSTLFGSDWSDLGGGDASDPENQNYTIPAGTGQRYIIIICDWNNGVSESNETNNIIIIPITVNAGMMEDTNPQDASKSMEAEAPAPLQLDVFPNPARDYLRIQWNEELNDELPTIRIMDLPGKTHEVQAERRKDGLFLTLKSLSNGAYVMWVQCGDRVAVERFIVSH
jgi:hypothetical protein